MATFSPNEHTPRIFFQSIRDGDLNACAYHLARMIRDHLTRYPNNLDALTIFISGHLLFALDLAGYLEVMEGIPVEPTIEREISLLWPALQKDPDNVSIQLARNVLMRTNVISDINPFELPGAADGNPDTIPDTPQAGLVRSVSGYLNAHFADPDISVSFLAEHFSVSVSYLSRVFHESMGIKLGNYILTLRYQQARLLLRTTDKPVDEIAAECGFASASAFIRSFRANEGVTPGNYRKQTTLAPVKKEP